MVEQLTRIEEKSHFITGRVHPQFKSVVDVFKQNFDKELEDAGASFAVYKGDQLVVSIQGGLADVEKGTPWNDTTRTVLFSTTKSISSVILAYSMWRNDVSYETKICEIWPEFAQFEKEHLTILDATLHRAGLAYTNDITKREDMNDPEKIASFFEKATPCVPYGQIVYHTLTYGLLIDQLVRRIDEKKRGIVEILDEDFVDKYDIPNLSIGLRDLKDNDLMATLTELSDSEVMRQGKSMKSVMWKFFAGTNNHTHNVYLTYPWITTSDYNLLENRMLRMPSNMGISNAEGLARFHSILTTRKILNQKFFDDYQKPVVVSVKDQAIGYEESKGYGFQYTKNPKDQWIFGHSGFGGQNVRMDLHNDLTYAYVTNGLKIADADDVVPWMALVKEVYKCL